MLCWGNQAAGRDPYLVFERFTVELCDRTGEEAGKLYFPTLNPNIGRNVLSEQERSPGKVRGVCVCRGTASAPTRRWPGQAPQLNVNPARLWRRRSVHRLLVAGQKKLSTVF